MVWLRLRSCGWIGVVSLVACGPTADAPEGGGETSGEGTGADEGTGTPGPASDTGAIDEGTGDGDDARPTDDTSPAGTSTTDDGVAESTGFADSGEDTDATGGSGVALSCPSAQWELRVTGTGQRAHEGRTIWASAVEPEQDPSAAVPTVVVEDVVDGGAFDLSCATGLSENSAYPSLAVVIDVDGDGACSDGDLGWTLQLFGWLGPQVYGFEGTSVFDLQGDPPWLVDPDAWRPVDELESAWGVPFCTYYFPNR